MKEVFWPLQPYNQPIIGFLRLDNPNDTKYDEHLAKILELLRHPNRFYTRAEAETIQAFDPDVIIIEVGDFQIFDFGESMIERHFCHGDAPTAEAYICIEEALRRGWCHCHPHMESKWCHRPCPHK